MKYTINNVRKMFLDFFQKNQHTIISSSSLLPNNHSNLLFTNAGMNQFQDIFLGYKKYHFPRVTTAQRCLRMGGKHNDFKQVGYSEHHHTFFEMLGNFSFGDYFKKESILYAWKLLTNKKWFNLPKNKFFVTVYQDDQETYNIWKNIIQLPEYKIIRIGNKLHNTYESDNFWQMGDTGPCGPCTEIFFNQSNDEKIYLHNLNDSNKYIEIWNIVFIQFNRINHNKLIPLSTFSVDTGMGLERITAILQKVHSTFKIDAFQNLIKSICQINKIDNNKNHQSINIIADHIRASTFIINDNILPNHEHRGYILRKIIRRALLHGYKLGIKKNFLYKLVSSVIKYFGNFKKKLYNQQKKIENIIQTEELQFKKILEKGFDLLLKKIENIKNNKLDANTIFYLHDTFGFPIDLTQDICQEYQINIDIHELNNIISQHKKKSQQNIINKNAHTIHTNTKSIFQGYKYHTIKAKIKQIFICGEEKSTISENEEGIIILDKTPFYGESGGQIGDNGKIFTKKSIFYVNNVQHYSYAIGHIGKIQLGKIKINDIITAQIDIKKRLLIQNNHSATHLLHSALNLILKTNIHQQGSFINEKYLRFDFSHTQKINKDQISYIEKKINYQIQKNKIIYNHISNINQAQLEKYTFRKNKHYYKTIRMLTIGSFSKELCGGTHAQRTGNIGLFKITSTKTVSSGVYRIEATTGKYALNIINIQNQNMLTIQEILKVQNSEILQKIKKIIYYYTELKKENQILNHKITLYYTKQLSKNIIKIKNINFLSSEINIHKRKLLNMIIDQLKKVIHIGIIILFYQYQNKYICIISLTKNIIHKIQANKIVEIIKQYTHCSGGGKLKTAECLIDNINNFDKILPKIKLWITKNV
ncbi:alanine--tRNA ligase [Buchnera aphidicola]|uniref:Alanine--tRNA ligase n=1 Tax=Buchnera aphidicola (Stegophylla sp.) TaxID=2315800 RepID=A0A4D6YAG0_9GAMM|nr:alanine--tRNA ligase [Buchnera aphidicola (Stegophylla sp.)]QCI26419.1 alanine--tRNA ligase [Buchnera aphidicola (Stegophylla sp.)]